MPVTVIVTGVPRRMSLHNLAVEFNEVFSDEDLGDFRIRDINTESNSKRKVALDFESGFDAMTVQHKLNYFEFVTSDGSFSSLKARIKKSDEELEQGSEVVISTNSKDDYYEVNPVALDDQIDIIKKQTLALKAQRKLLREQMKLKKEYKQLNKDSDDDDTSKTYKGRSPKRRRLESSEFFERSKPRDKNTSFNEELNNRARSKSRGDYLPIEYENTTHRSESCYVKRVGIVATSKTPEKQKTLQSNKHRSRSRSRDKCCSIEYKRSSKIRRSDSPQSSSRRRKDWFKSGEIYGSPTRTSGSSKRRSRSRSHGKYYPVETIEYKKALLTKARSPKSGSKYEITERYHLSSKPSNRSPYKDDLPIRIESREFNKARSRSKSKSLKSDKFRSPSNERKSSAFKKSLSKYYEGSSKSRHNSSGMINKQSTSQGFEEQHEDDEFRKNAKVQSKKRQAIGDVLFEMELLRRQRNDTISEADDIFLNNLVREIVKNRFMKIEIHDKLNVSEIVARYRSLYSKEDDRALLRNLASECKSLHEVTSTVIAYGTAHVSPPPTHNDEIWTAVDEVLDGIDLDVLQADRDTNEVNVNEDVSQTNENETVTSNRTSNDTHKTKVNSTSVNNVSEYTAHCMVVDIEKPKIKQNKTIEKVLSSCTGKPSYKAPLHKQVKDLIDDNLSCINPIKAHVNVTKEKNIHTIVLSDDSDSEVNCTKQSNAIAVNRNSSSDTITIEQQNTNLTTVKKRNVATIDLTDDTEGIDTNRSQTNIGVPAACNKHIKKETVTIDIIDSTTNSNQTDIPDDHTRASLIRNIKQENDKTDPRSSEESAQICIKQDPDIEQLGVIRNHSIHRVNEGPIENTAIITDILRSIKKENETITNSTKSGINNDTSNITMPVPLTSLKHEAAAVNDSTKPCQQTDGNYDQVIMPVPFIEQYIKNEDDPATFDDSTEECHESGSNNEQVIMPVPFIEQSIKNEDDAITIVDSTRQCSEIGANNGHVIMPAPFIGQPVDNEDDATIIDHSIEQCLETGANNEEEIMPEPFIEQSIKTEDDAITINDSTQKCHEPGANNEKVIMPVPFIEQLIKSEDDATTIDDSTDQCPEASANNDQVLMPVPFIKQSIKSEDDATTIDDSTEQCLETGANNEEVLMPVPFIEQSIKSKDDATTIDDSTDQCPEASANNNQVFMPVPFHEGFIKNEKEAPTLADSTEQSQQTNVNNDPVIMLVPFIQQSIKNGDDAAAIDDSSKQSQETGANDQMVMYVPSVQNHLVKVKENEVGTDKSIVVKSEISEKSKLLTSTENKEQMTNKKQDLVIKKEKCLPASPRFVVPTYVILRSLKSTMKNKFSEHEYLFSITKKVLNKRFRKIVKGKDYMKSQKIVQIYKQKYSEEKYEKFLKKIVKGINKGKYDEDIKNIQIQMSKTKKQPTSESD